ncbi:MAG: hypothetical protein LBO75_01465 [Bifidobacteriaceae bacterium]|nr:hypothetical protein [Bifidobacteriaceae bacterium]
MTDHTKGVIDTCVLIDLALYNLSDLPDMQLVTALTMAELAEGVAVARNDADREARAQVLAIARRLYAPLPFDFRAARRYEALATLVVAAGRKPKPRRIDLMIAATAAANVLPLYTSNPDDYRGLEPEVTVVAVSA